ncbi:MAG: trypsin-like serine protease [Labilithrix sp.]|nr:trypsin-like serine protease [Labilithrix sp.]MCW5812948.1 trypsin-like serine protease [Labilithrix sp.]
MTLRPAIVGGAPSDASQDAVVFLFHYDAAADRATPCTGTLVAPRLVLTARHCVSAGGGGAIACTSDGTQLGGGAIGADFAAPDIHVYAGRERPPFTRQAPRDIDPARWTPAARGAALFHDGARTLCDHDLALVLLDAPIADVPLAPLRLDRDARAGELVVAIGYGKASAEYEPARQERRDVPVKKVGPDDAHPVLGRSELAFPESICEGDSGGPLLAQDSGAIVGIVSRGVTGDPVPDRPGDHCLDVDNIATKLPPFRGVIDRAFQAAGATPLEEPEPPGGCFECAAARGHAAPDLALVLATVIVLYVVTARSSRSGTAR